MAPTYETSVSKITGSAERSYPGGSSLGIAAQRENGTSPRPGAPAEQTSPASQASLEDSRSYRVTLSEEALRKMGLLNDGDPGAKTSGDKSNTAEKNSAETSSADAQRLAYLKQRDREVRAHEQAHVIAGGSLVRGGASFGYASGPDGRLYAVSGEVSIDASPVPDDPEATVRKMNQVIKAALAPAQPSGQDRAVASSASSTQMAAQSAIAQERVDAMQGKPAQEQTGSAAQTETNKAGAPAAPKAAGVSASLGSEPSPLVSKYINVAA